MEFRVPLSYVLGSPLSQRHAIPHYTLVLDAVHPFIQYLDSDDTRLPQHPILTVVPQPAGDYETYVGEDDWIKGDDANSDDTNSALHFDDVVEWVIEIWNKLDDNGNGVVLCGRRVVADDCGWAVISRTPTLHSVRDVFIAMRNSSKFLHDVHYQLQGEEGGTGSLRVEITLARALGGDPAKEFRVFLPYRLYKSGNDARVEAWENHMYAGISQRATDVCLPTLIEWDVATHEENYNIVTRHVQHARLLEQAFEKDSQLRAALLRCASVLSFPSHIQEKKSCVVLLAVDVLFESPSLPVHVLSAALQCFRHDDARDLVCAFPFILEDDTILDGSKDRNGNESDERNSEWGMPRDPVSFFCLFRDVFNWNFHVEAWRQHYSGETVTCDSEKGRRFFVIASERSDLATAKESIAKRGLPLEFVRPELFLDEDSATQEWREKLVQCLSMVGKF